MEQTELEVLGRHPPQQNVLPIGEIAIKRDVYFFPLTLLSLSMSLQPAVSVLKDQCAWGLSHQPSGIAPDTPLQPPLHVPQTPTAPQTQKQSKQNASLPVLSCLGKVTGEGSAVLSCKDWQGNKRGKKILNVSISPAFCFSFCKYSALFLERSF